jgi:alpha/beta superfamily hydrolase/dienelactone hydrolase
VTATIAPDVGGGAVTGTAAARAAAAPAPEPMYVGSEDRPWLAWLHRPAPARDTGVGLVIVPAFGYEAVCAHRSMRQLAIDAAAAGVTAARIDLDGTGDSAGDDLDPDRWGAWCASVRAACELVRAQGATRLVLAGLRVGVMLAAAVAAERDDVAGLIAIAPVVSGRRWVREMRALQQALALAPPPPGRETPDDIQEAIGFALTSETRDVLSAIDLEKGLGKGAPEAMARPPAPAVLILDRHDLVSGEKWAARLRGQGADVDHRKLPGYTEMVLDPHRAVVPVEIVAAAVEFAAARPPLATASPAPATVRTAPRARFAAARADVIEEPVAIDGALRAIVTRPASGTPHRALILLNAGGVRWIGPNRLYVALARRLAAEQGALVMRADLGAIGDSDTRPGYPETQSYPPHAIGDVAALVAWTRAHGPHEVTLAGLCSGGYYAREAVLAGQPVAGVIIINPGELAALTDPSLYEAPAAAARYKQQLRNPGIWKKVRRLRTDPALLRRTAVNVALRARGMIENRATDLLRRFGVALPGDAFGRLAAQARRGLAVSFVFCADEAGLLYFRERGGAALPRLLARGVVELTVLDGIDHTFTARWSHPLLLDELSRAFRRHRPARDA